MRIQSVNMPQDTGLNLDAIQMDKLGPTVIIAGRNGAGKSRLLSKITRWAGQYRQQDELQRQVLRHRLALRMPNRPDRALLEKQLSQYESDLQSLPHVTLSEKIKPIIVPFVPNKLDLSDPNEMSKSSIQTAAKKVETPGISHLSGGTFARIQLLQDRKWEATHPNKTFSETEATSAIAEYERMQTLVRQFVNTEITRSANGEAELFSLALGKTALSAGQKVVLQLCVAIHAQGANLNNLIIFMDEPENHLHPAVLLDLVEAVQKHNKDGQLWISTHSIALLAEVDPSAIWWMEENTISKAGSKPEKVLGGLLGDEQRRNHLAAFLDLPFALASNRFAAECLLPPNTVPHKSGDAQTRQIREVLETLRITGSPLRVLDFGAGKGRLASELAEAWTPEQCKRLDYIAFDPSIKDNEECLAAISRLCGDPDNRLFHDATALRARYDEGSFHVVVLCNVLHEIPPTSWGELFGPQGKITRLLRPEGFLMLVEVQQLPYGEKAHQNGFLVLDTAQLRKLFAIEEADLSGFVVDERREGWIKAHLVAQPLLSRFSAVTREAALEDLISTSRDRIRELRANPPDYCNGRLHGFWVQQFANAQLALT